ncbi:MAG: hypothetical protein EKK40_01880 [Bradyrhizobiaceae bacterium]|nr:MAG: hypothetical protein EKK40_01880 [Bradyrhizobiaceae bacterium]
MSIRKFTIIALALALFGASAQSSKATPVPLPIAAAASAGPAIVGGVLGFAVLAIAYDLYLKSIGVKSWDGVTPPKKPHRR